VAFSIPERPAVSDLTSCVPAGPRLATLRARPAVRTGCVRLARLCCGLGASTDTGGSAAPAAGFVSVPCASADVSANATPATPHIIMTASRRPLFVLSDFITHPRPRRARRDYLRNGVQKIGELRLCDCAKSLCADVDDLQTGMQDIPSLLHFGSFT
jgi:hypothetical protein